MPVPAGLDVAKAREEGKQAAEQAPPPSKTKSVAQAIGTWVDERFVQHRVFTIVTLVLLVLVIPIAYMAVASVINALSGTPVHYGKGADDQLMQKEYGTEEFRKQAREQRVYKKRLGASKETTGESGDDALAAEMLTQANSLREQGKIDGARATLKRLIEKHPTSPQAKEAHVILEELPEAPK